MEVLIMALDKYDFELINYTIMDDHFHFVIKTLDNGETISRIMQFIKSQFARRYNRMLNRTGPFWNERFTDIIIEETIEPVHTFWYIFMHMGFDPVWYKYVKDPRHYSYSGFRLYLDTEYRGVVPITLSEYFLLLGNSFKERIKKLLEYEDLYRRRVFPEELFN